MDGRKSVRVDNLSKLSTIEELREKLSSDFDVAPDKQRLFYRGKQARLVFRMPRVLAIDFLMLMGISIQSELYRRIVTAGWE